MLKRKTLFSLFCGLFFVTATLPGESKAEETWSVASVDYETHLNNADLTQGSYTETGAWTSWSWASSSNGAYRYLTFYIDPNRHGIAFWRIQIPKTGFYKIETSYLQTENRTYDADFAVYVNETTGAAANHTATPVYAAVINQHGPTAVIWKELGTYCLKKDDISMIVLDNMDDSGSASADASRWTFIGDTYNSQNCLGGANMVPINSLLLKTIPE